MKKPGTLFDTPHKRQDFADRLLDWFESAKRPLPWRQDYQPYRVWISEIMLQQTQMERGVGYFNEWMRRFPDIGSVARADEDAILAAWEGLGYYARARNLHAAAKLIVREYGGRFPDTPDDIRALPGVGEYSAAAIASIAFNIPEPAVDANVLRIFSRLLDIDAPVTAKGIRKAVTETVRSLIPGNSPRLFNQALMELGALVCGKTLECQLCPVARFCLAMRMGTAASRPVKTAKTRYTIIESVAAVAIDGTKVYVRKRPAGGLWAGLWEFPGGRLEPGEEPATAAGRIFTRETGVTVVVGEKIGSVRHSYTTNRVTLHGYVCVPVSDFEPEGKWVGRETLRDLSFAAGHRKLLELLGWK